MHMYKLSLLLADDTDPSNLFMNILSGETVYEYDLIKEKGQRLKVAQMYLHNTGDFKNGAWPRMLQMDYRCTMQISTISNVTFMTRKINLPNN